jgi:hypothetical protein
MVPLIGYVDRLSARPGERIRRMVAVVVSTPTTVKAAGITPTPAISQASTTTPLRRFQSHEGKDGGAIVWQSYPEDESL